MNYDDFLRFRYHLQNCRHVEQNKFDIGVLTASLLFGIYSFNPFFLISFLFMLLSCTMSTISFTHATKAWDNEYLEKESNPERVKEKWWNRGVDLCNLLSYATLVGGFICILQ